MPRKITATVKYLPCLGSHAVIIFFASNICWINSGTVNARYNTEPFAVSGAKPGLQQITVFSSINFPKFCILHLMISHMKKCNLGNGTIFTANLRKSAFN